MSAVLGCVLALAATQAYAIGVSEVIGAQAKSLEGKSVGALQDLIIDVRAGRVLYVIVEGAQRHVTLPLRALGDGMALDMSLAGAVARIPSQSDPRFRRAAKLLGQSVVHTGGEPIGTIRDIRFDRESGRIEDVVLETDQGPRDFPASVLAHGRFPPLTRWQVEYPGEGTTGGFIIFPSDERTRLHDHQW